MRSPLLTVFLAAAALPCFAVEPARIAAFPKTKSGVHLEMVFNYQLSQDQLGSESGVVDQVWGSSWATLPPGMYNSAYIPYSVDNFTNSIAWYQANHPDWLEYKCDRTNLAFEFGSTTLAPLDVANPDVRAYQWANWIDAPLAAGYRSIAVDTLTLTNDWQRCGHYDGGGHWVRQYSGQADDMKFRRDVLRWERLTYKHVHGQNASATMQVNFSYNFSQSKADNETMMTTTDLLFDERGFTNWGNAVNLPTPDEWTTIVSELQFVQSQGLCYTVNGQEPDATADITPAERQWAVGNYLLVRNGCTYMYMTGQQDYGKLVAFPEYAIAIGRPKGAMMQTQGIWERAYSNGLTLVNPYDNTAVVGLPRGHWVDVNGDPAGPTVSLDKQTALILLKAHP